MKSVCALILLMAGGCQGVKELEIPLELDSADPIRTWYQDWDQDGFGNPEMEQEARFQPQGWVPNDGDCDDGNSEVNPAADELCDGVDNDCDDEVDEAGCDSSATARS